MAQYLIVISSKPRLPFLEALFLETLRWQPVSPMGGPRATIDDCIYNGWLIPKVSSQYYHKQSQSLGLNVLIGNHCEHQCLVRTMNSSIPWWLDLILWAYFYIRAISRDTSMFPDPEIFDPTRFLGSWHDKKVDPRFITFGAGRRFVDVAVILHIGHCIWTQANWHYGTRSCPGNHYGEAAIWVTIATLAATTRLSKALDDDGVEITPPVEFTDGLIRYDRLSRNSSLINLKTPLFSAPIPFKAKFEPRSPHQSHLIENIVSNL